MKNKELILNLAAKYAIGRRTYVVSATAHQIIQNWSYLSESFQKEIQSLIRNTNDLGDRCDADEWWTVCRLDITKDKRNESLIRLEPLMITCALNYALVREDIVSTNILYDEISDAWNGPLMLNKEYIIRAVKDKLKEHPNKELTEIIDKFRKLQFND